MAEILTLGTGRVTDTDGSQIPPVVRGLLEGSDDPEDISDEGDVPLMCALGLTALPAAEDDGGHAEGVFVEVPCYGTACIAGRDTRCADVYGKLKAGETAVHNTGGDTSKRSRMFLKEDCCSIIVGNDLVVMLDRKNAKITITGFGHIFEMAAGADKGITMMTKGGKATIHMMERGAIDIIAGEINLGGALSASTPATAVLCGVSGMTGIPSTALGQGVYIRP